MTLLSLGALRAPLLKTAGKALKSVAKDSNVVAAGKASKTFTLLSALAIAISYADRSNLSTAIIPMTQIFSWDSFFSGIVLSSFWAGYALTNVIGGRLADQFGGERLLIAAMITWSACTALTPVSAFWGPLQLVLTRVLLGAGEGLAYPAIHTMIQKYVPRAERSSSTGIVTGACYLGALASNLVSPWLISRFGWQENFIAFAFLCPVLWLPFWLRFIQNQQGDSKPSLDTNEFLPSMVHHFLP